MENIRIAVLGGGLSGITAAMKLAKKEGFNVDLFEREARLGGLQNSVILKNLVYDIGSFVFGPTYEFLNVFPEIGNDFIRIHPNLKKITPYNTVEKYPIDFQGLISSIGIKKTFLIPPDIIKSNIFYHNPNNSEDWVKHIIGKRLYEYSGLKNYIKRLFDKNASEIGLNFASQRLQYLQMGNIVHSISTKIFKSASHNIESEQYVLGRPLYGFQVMYGNVFRQLEKEGVSLNMNALIESIDIQTNKVIIKINDVKKEYDILISTIPVSEIFTLLGKTPSAKYEHVNLVSLFYQGDINFSGNIFCNYSKKGKWKRLTSFSDLYNQPTNKPHFTVEITTKASLPIDIVALRADFEQHVKELGLIDNPEFLGSSILNNAYPVFHVDDEINVKKDIQTLSMLGIHSTGRQGLYEYSSSQTVLEQTKKVIEGIISLY